MQEKEPFIETVGSFWRYYYAVQALEKENQSREANEERRRFEIARQRHQKFTNLYRYTEDLEHIWNQLGDDWMRGRAFRFAQIQSAEGPLQRILQDLKSQHPQWFEEATQRYKMRISYDPPSQ